MAQCKADAAWDSRRQGRERSNEQLVFEYSGIKVCFLWIYFKAQATDVPIQARKSGGWRAARAERKGKGDVGRTGQEADALDTKAK